MEEEDSEVDRHPLLLLLRLCAFKFAALCVRCAVPRGSLLALAVGLRWLV